MKTKKFMVFVYLFIFLPSVILAQGGWVTLPGQAFIPQSSNYQWDNEIFGGGQNYVYPLGTGNVNLVAPIVFPPEADGLSVRQMNVTVGDFDDEGRVYVWLFRMNRYSGVAQVVFSASTSSDAPGKIIISDATGPFRLIDNQKYAWFIYAHFNEVPTPADNLRLYSARIQYQ